MELTKQQIERQDFVDNMIFRMINELTPSGKEIEWDIELIANIRDVIQSELVKKGVCSDQVFYPYIDEC